IPVERIPDERRVPIVPDGVRALCAAGHEVSLEAGAGEGSGIGDEDFAAAGARVCHSLAEVYERSDLIVKVKQPVEEEWGLLREGQGLFDFLLAATRPELTRALLEGGVIAICYERMRAPDGTAPILTPMSEIAGKLAILVAGQYLKNTDGGPGVLMAAVGHVEPPHVLILGGGVVGHSAASMALAIGAAVTIVEADDERAGRLRRAFPEAAVAPSTPEAIGSALPSADLLVNAVMWDPVARPRLVSREMLGDMKRGSVIVDVAADAGGAIETCEVRPLSDPVYEVEGVRHYCVPNMPASVPRTATFALSAAVLPYVALMANRGITEAIKSDETLASGVCFVHGLVTNERIAGAQDLEYTPPSQALAD
ncbi:MAG: alanine dehydrogenase, partial [Armatimonadota bacterium]